MLKHHLFKTRYISTLIVALFSQHALALEPFVIKDIRVEGLQRTEAGTIFTYLPVQAGDVMSDEKATQAIKSLYNTGFFKDVRIEADGDVLVVCKSVLPLQKLILVAINHSHLTK